MDYEISEKVFQVKAKPIGDLHLKDVEFEVIVYIRYSHNAHRRQGGCKRFCHLNSSRRGWRQQDSVGVCDKEHWRLKGRHLSTARREEAQVVRT